MIQLEYLKKTIAKIWVEFTLQPVCIRLPPPFFSSPPTTIAKSDPERTLLEAAQKGELSDLQKLLNQKVCPTVQDQKFQRTALHWALAKRHSKCACFLIPCSDINAQDLLCQETPLYLAVKAGDKQMLFLLLERGADITLKDRFGKTPLMWATEKGFVELLPLLYKERDNLDERDHEGKTPLMWALEHPNLSSQMVACLLLYDADPRICDTKGKNFLWHIIEKLAFPIIDVLSSAYEGFPKKDCLYKLLLQKEPLTEMSPLMFAATKPEWAPHLSKLVFNCPPMEIFTAQNSRGKTATDLAVTEEGKKSLRSIIQSVKLNSELQKKFQKEGFESSLYITALIAIDYLKNLILTQLQKIKEKESLQIFFFRKLRKVISLNFLKKNLIISLKF